MRAWLPVGQIGLCHGELEETVVVDGHAGGHWCITTLVEGEQAVEVDERNQTEHSVQDPWWEGKKGGVVSQSWLSSSSSALALTEDDGSDEIRLELLVRVLHIDDVPPRSDKQGGDEHNVRVDEELVRSSHDEAIAQCKDGDAEDGSDEPPHPPCDGEGIVLPDLCPHMHQHDQQCNPGTATVQHLQPLVGCSSDPSDGIVLHAEHDKPRVGGKSHPSCT